MAYTHSNAQSQYVVSDAPETDVIWSQWPYNQWFDNYLLTVGSIRVITGGSGYAEPPVVTIVGNSLIPATATAILNASGEVVAIVVTNPGSGYQETPTVEFTSDSGSGAKAYPVLTNGLVRSFKTVIKYDRNQYVSTIIDWSATATYTNGELVRFDNRVWTPKTTAGPSSEFLIGDWDLVPAEELSGADRTMGFYVPSANEPGLQLSLLIDGIDYPGVQVYGRDFEYIDPLDAIYASSFTDQYLGLRPTDINVNGGEFIGPYEGHAPEELVNGSEYDTLDLRVYTRPGSDWELDGHGFEFRSVRYRVEPDIAIRNYSWGQLVQTPVQVLVSNVTTGYDLTPDVDYTVDWVNKSIEIINNDLIGNTINITVYEVGGGSQLYRAYYTGEEAGSSIIVPVADAEISDVAVFVDGEAVSGQTWQPYTPHTVWSVSNTYQFKDVVTSVGLYYRAIQDVPAGILINNEEYWTSFVPSQFSIVYFNTTYPADSGVAILVLGDPTIYEGDQPYDSTVFDVGDTTGFPGTFDFGIPINPNPYSWSTPQVQYVVADSTVVDDRTLVLTNSIEGTNPANLILTRNGLRMFPPAGACYVGIEGTGYDVGGFDEIGFDDGSIFALPTRMGESFSQDTIDAATDVRVWVNSVLQTQGVDYFVTPYTGANTRDVVFYTAVPETSLVVISVSTIADYTVDMENNTIVMNILPNLGDEFAITTWNDTQQQDICTLVFVGPVNNGTPILIDEPYDDTLFSEGDISFDPGSYDFSEGGFIPANAFYLHHPGITANRLWVTLDGYRLFEGVDFVVSNDYLILASGTINSSQKLVVTLFTESIVPDAMAFRIFQDMRGVQATFRITDSTTTVLTDALLADADIIYVKNAQHLTEPNMTAGVFGVITIDGERIMYRERDLANNTVSSLLRGTAGTAAADHAIDSLVYDMGRGNLMPVDQDYVDSDTSIADGETSSFIAPNISYSSLHGEDSGIDTRCVEVFVGGIRQIDNFVVDPSAMTTEENNFDILGYSDTPYSATDFVGVMITLDYAPPAGVEVTILVRRGTWWYDVSTVATRRLPLQQTNTRAARYLRGL